MLLGRLFWHEENKKKRDRFSIGRIEGDGDAKAQKSAGGFLEALDATVRNRYALTESGRTEFLAGEQAIEDNAAGNSPTIFKQCANLLKNAFFTARLQIEDDIFKGQ